MMSTLATGIEQLHGRPERRGDRLRPELAGFDGALPDTDTSCASDRVECRDAVAPLIGSRRR
jgi:hypothetical protein